MLQRFIFEALRRGHAAYRASNGELYKDLFQKVYEFSDSEVNNIRQYFDRYPTKIYHGFPRDSIDQHPSLYIFQQSESQPGFAVADYGGAGAAPVSPSLATGILQAPPVAVPNAFVLSSLWTHQYQILCLARGAPDPAMWLVEISKSILLAAKTYFLSKAIQTPILACSEIQFRDDLAPADLFARSITFQCGREFSQTDTSQALQDVFKIGGLIGEPGSDTHPEGRPTSHVEVLPWGVQGPQPKT